MLIPASPSDARALNIPLWSSTSHVIDCLFSTNELQVVYVYMLHSIFRRRLFGHEAVFGRLTRPSDYTKSAVAYNYRIVK